MNALLILNDHAGSLNGKRNAMSAEQVRDVLDAAGIHVSVRSTPPNGLCDTLQRAIAERPDAIFAGGGDGTISAAATCLVGTDIPLGVLPLGTLNHFARDLGLPLDWRECLHALTQSRSCRVDLGEVNGRVFINNCSIGSYPDAVRRRETLRRKRGMAKWWAMAHATVNVFRELRRLRMQIELGGETRQLRTPFVVVANNRYSAHVLDYSLRPRLDEGKLWIYTTRAGRRLALVRLMWRSLLHKIDAVQGLEQWGVTEAAITREQGPLPIAVDGEVADMKLPLRFRSLPHALRVLAPIGKRTET